MRSPEQLKETLLQIAKADEEAGESGGDEILEYMNNFEHKNLK